MEVNVNNKLMKPRPFRWTSSELVHKTVFSSEEETDKVLILSELDHKSHA